MGHKDWGKMQLRNAASEWRAGFGPVLQGLSHEASSTGHAARSPAGGGTSPSPISAARPEVHYRNNLK